jgi:putative polyhydroxyalkanoate system protein
MKIRRSHGLGLEAARERIDHVSATLGSQYSLTSSWEGDQVHVAGTGVQGRIVVASEFVEAEIRLGLPLMMMRHQIRSRIEELMDEHFGRPPE